MKVSEILQVETSHAPGNLASVLNIIAEAGLVLEHVSTIRRDQDRTLWELTVEMDESVHAELLARWDALPTARFVGWSDRVFDRHRGGKIEMRSRVTISVVALGAAGSGIARLLHAHRRLVLPWAVRCGTARPSPQLHRLDARCSCQRTRRGRGHGPAVAGPLDVSVHERVSQAVQAAIIGSAPAPLESTSAAPS